MPFKVSSRRLSLFLNLGFDFLLLNIAFVFIYYAKRGHFHFEPAFLHFIPAYTLTWLLASLSSRKFRDYSHENLLLQLKPFILSTLVQIGFLSITLYAFKLFDLSRFIVFGSLGLFFIFELVFLSASYLYPFILKKEKRTEYYYSFWFFLFEFILISSTFLAIYFYKRGSLDLTDEYKAVFLIIYFSWMFIGLTVHKFQLPKTSNFIRAIWPFFKSFVIVLGLLSFFVFAFRTMQYSRLILFGSMSLFFLFEFLFVSIYYLYKRPQETDETPIDLFRATLIEEPKEVVAPPEFEKLIDSRYVNPVDDVEPHSIRRKLETIYLRKFPEIYQFLDDVIDLSSFDMMTSEVISSGNPYNVEVLPDESLCFFLNLHEVNDFRRINHYFIEVNKKLKPGGVFVGRFEPFTKRRERFLKTYPYYIANILYLFDFLWKRVFPKLPFFQKIYFAVSKGRKRVLSKAEGLGRLYYCGFEVIAIKEIENFIYFAVRKVKKPATDLNPSYSPVFKMRRLGKDGRLIYVYKFRTMHPYSEYLQDYVLRVNGYSEIGKPANDFRVTTWGKFLRKYWLDELPQLINLLRGEMKLVGVRPVSERFLAEFPEEIRQLRLKHKPSCIPAYVSLLKQSKDGFIEAETKYILEKEEYPLLTDIKYFCRAIYNIFTNKIRSA